MNQIGLLGNIEYDSSEKKTTIRNIVGIICLVFGLFMIIVGFKISADSPDNPGVIIPFIIGFFFTTYGWKNSKGIIEKIKKLEQNNNDTTGKAIRIFNGLSEKILKIFIIYAILGVVGFMIIFGILFVFAPEEIEPPGPGKFTFGSLLLGLWGIISLFIGVRIVLYTIPREEAELEEEFNSALIPTIGKTFSGIVEGWFYFSGTDKNGKFFTFETRNKAKSATITFQGDYLSVEGTINIKDIPIKYRDYIIASSTTLLSYKGIGRLQIHPDPHIPHKSGNKISYAQPNGKTVKIICDTEDDAISLWNGLMNIWLKEKDKRS